MEIQSLQKIWGTVFYQPAFYCAMSDNNIYS